MASDPRLQLRPGVPGRWWPTAAVPPPDAKRYLADFKAHNPSTDAQQVIAQEDLEAKIAALGP